MTLTRQKFWPLCFLASQGVPLGQQFSNVSYANTIERTGNRGARLDACACGGGEGGKDQEEGCPHPSPRVPGSPELNSTE